MSSPIDPERLLAHRAWLTRLARELVRDGQGAEDLVQSAWVAALERPPRAQDEQGIRAWLASVLRNLARAGDRSEARRRARERHGARPGSAPSVAEALERFSLQREVVDAVLALEPPAREIVVLRYFDGLPPREIAARLGLSGSAVRTRLSRALEVLRARLGADRDDRRGRWAALAARPVPTAAGALILGGLTVKTHVVAGTALALLSLLGLGLAVRHVAAPTAPAVPRAESGSPDGALVLGPTAPDGAERAVDAREPLASPADGGSAPGEHDVAGAETVHVLGRCIDSAGDPLAGVTVAAPSRPEGPSARSGADGRFELSLAWIPGETHPHEDLIFSGAGLARRPLRATIAGPGELAVGDVTLEPGGVVLGRVVDASGAPLAGARVSAWREPTTADGGELDPAQRAKLETWGTYVLGWCATRTENDGTFRLEGAPATRFCVAAWAPGRLHAWSEALDLPAGGTRRVADLVLREPGPERLVGGRVLAPDGSPVEQAYVVVTLEGEDARSPDHEWTDAEGRFEVVVAPGRAYLVEASDRRERWNRVTHPGVPAGTHDLTIRFPEARWIEVEARDAEGRPVANPRVWAGAPIHAEPTDPPHPGRVRVRVPEGTFHLGVAAPGYPRTSRGPFTAEDVPERLVFELRAASAITGTVTAAGRAVAGAEVHAHVVLDEPALFSEGLATSVEPHLASRAVTAEDGTFRLPVARAGRVVVHVENEGFARAEVGPLDVREGAQLAGIEVALDAGGALEGRIVVPAEATPSGWVVAASRGDGHVVWQAVDVDGAFAREGLTPGEWQVIRVHPERVHFLESSGLSALPEELEGERVDVVAGLTSRVELDHAGELPCTLRGRFRVGGERPRTSSFWIANEIERVHATLDAVGAFEVRSRRAGRHSLVLRDDRAGLSASYYVLLDLESGVNERDFDVPAGSLAIDGARGAVELSWESGDGIQWSARIEPDADGRAVLEPVPAGTLTLADAAPDAHFVERTVDVRAGERATVAIE